MEPCSGVLLVGGESTRFGSPKALARLDGETLAERAWRTLGEACDERLAVGKLADGLQLPFELLDDGTEVRAALAGVVAGLRAARYEVCVFLPVDMPTVTAELLCELVEACDEAASPAKSPFPCAIRRTAEAELSERVERGELGNREALAALRTRYLEIEPSLLLNVNTPEELQKVG